jgi:hypothetical protein
MRFTSCAFFAFSLFAANVGPIAASAQPIRIVDTHMRLEGACAKIFGRTRINFGAVSHQPVAPLQYDTNETGVCTVVVTLTDNKTSKPIEGLPVEVSRLLSTDSSGVKDQLLGTPKTDKDGNAKIRFRWSPKSCGVYFRPSDPSDELNSALINSTTLLTGRALLQIQNCQGTFIEQGFSREDICKGEPKDD